MTDSNLAHAWWRLQQGDGPIIATAIHDGHQLGPAASKQMKLAEAVRLREEDPHTGNAVADVATHVIPLRSRFEIDLNRALDQAVYLTPEQAWGLDVWQSPPSGELIAALQSYHRAFYRLIGSLSDDLAQRCGRFVVLDVHSYNHRRDGADAAPTPQQSAPDINIGTFSMPRQEWAFLLDPLIEVMRDFDFNGRHLDVRENVAFQGKGELTRFIHQRHPGRGCAIAIEFKKFYMDEWSGAPDAAELDAMRAFIRHVADSATRLLERAP